MSDGREPSLEILRRLNDSGYLFYRDPARVRADDLLVRARAADCLHRAAAVLSLAEQKLRRAIPAPSRETPFPDPVLLTAARDLKALQERIATLETRLRGPAALPDRDFSAIIPTEEVRLRLVTLDAVLLDRAAAIEAAAPALTTVLDGFEQALADRAQLTELHQRP